MIAYAVSGHALWAIVLAIGLVVVVVLAVLLTLLVEYMKSIEGSIDGLVEEVDGMSSGSSALPKLAAAAPVLAQLAEETDAQDKYLNDLTDRPGGR